MNVNAISIHVPREGHDHESDRIRFFASGISIHVPREGHDKFLPMVPNKTMRFQSTCPARGTTLYLQHGVVFESVISIHVPREGHDSRRPVRFDIGRIISIHVPREGHDNAQNVIYCIQAHFNPRAPRGARHHKQVVLRAGSPFQSTCPARGTTARNSPGRA